MGLAPVESQLLSGALASYLREVYIASASMGMQGALLLDRDRPWPSVTCRWHMHPVLWGTSPPATGHIRSTGKSPLHTHSTVRRAPLPLMSCSPLAVESDLMHVLEVQAGHVVSMVASPHVLPLLTAPASSLRRLSLAEQPSSPAFYRSFAKSALGRQR